MEKLSLSDIGAYRNQGTAGIRSGGKTRYYCPIHGGDNQKSLEVNMKTGHFKCYTCGAWGYLRESDQRDTCRKQILPSPPRRTGSQKVNRPLPVFWDITPGSIGAKYLEARGITLEVACCYGVKFEPGNRRSAFGGNWQHGRLVFPHTDPGGKIVNYYGRAIGEAHKLSGPVLESFKSIKHRHLPGSKGIFNGAALNQEAVCITEGAFDALSLLQAGYNACAIFGTGGMKWEWTKARKVIFCFDADGPGQKGWRDLANMGIMQGVKIHYLPAERLEGHKDLNELLQARGSLHFEDLPKAR